MFYQLKIKFIYNNNNKSMKIARIIHMIYPCYYFAPNWLKRMKKSIKSDRYNPLVEHIATSPPNPKNPSMNNNLNRKYVKI